MILNYKRELYDLLTEVVSASYKAMENGFGYAELLRLRFEILSEINYAFGDEDEGTRDKEVADNVFIYRSPVDDIISEDQIDLASEDLRSKSLDLLLRALLGDKIFA